MNPVELPIGVRVTRVIAAPRECVFDAFVRPELRRLWWAAHPGDHCTVCEIDARVGGFYRINMISAEREFVTTGKFLEVLRPERLVFTWSWEVPPGFVEESLVTIDFKSVDLARTELTLAHDRLPSTELRALHAEGWGLCMDKLAAMIGDFPATPGEPSNRTEDAT